MNSAIGGSQSVAQYWNPRNLANLPAQSSGNVENLEAAKADTHQGVAVTQQQVSGLGRVRASVADLSHPEVGYRVNTARGPSSVWTNVTLHWAQHAAEKASGRREDTVATPGAGESAAVARRDQGPRVGEAVADRASRSSTLRSRVESRSERAAARLEARTAPVAPQQLQSAVTPGAEAAPQPGTAAGRAGGVATSGPLPERTREPLPERTRAVAVAAATSHEVAVRATYPGRAPRAGDVQDIKVQGRVGYSSFQAFGLVVAHNVATGTEHDHASQAVRDWLRPAAAPQRPYGPEPTSTSTRAWTVG